jgi:hypothetical protein
MPQHFSGARLLVSDFLRGALFPCDDPEWTAASVLEAERGFRRVTGYRALPKVAAALRVNNAANGSGAELIPESMLAYMTIEPLPKFNLGTDISGELTL